MPSTMLAHFRAEHFSQLKHIAVFALVADAGSFTRAAARLGIANSAVSRYISELEDQLGVSLLRRTRRRLYLTDTGERFFSECSRLVEAAVDSVDAVAENNCFFRKLHLSATHSYGRYVLLPAVSSFLGLHPQLSIQVSTNDSFVDLVEHGIDLAFRLGSPGQSLSHISRKIGKMRFRLFAAPSYLATTAAIKAPADTQEHAWVLYSGSPTPDDWAFTRGKQTWSIKANTRLSSDSAELLIEAGRDGLGLVGIPDFMCGKSVRYGLVERLPDYQIEPSVGIYAVYPKRQFLLPRAAVFWLTCRGWRLSDHTQARQGRPSLARSLRRQP